MNQYFPLAFLAGSLGAGEIMLVLLLALVLFGPKRLPELMRSLGKAVGELRRISKGFQDQLATLDQPLPPVNEILVKPDVKPAVDGKPSLSGETSVPGSAPLLAEQTSVPANDSQITQSKPAAGEKPSIPGDGPHDIAG